MAGMEEADLSSFPLEELRSLVAGETFSPLPWTPMPGMQLEALQSQADVCLCGGAAGGGKSNLLAGLATQVAKQSLLVRREYSQIAPLILEIEKILGGRDGLNIQAGYWRLSGSRLIRLMGCPNLG